MKRHADSRGKGNWERETAAEDRKALNGQTARLYVLVHDIRRMNGDPTGHTSNRLKAVESFYCSLWRQSSALGFVDCAAAVHESEATHARGTLSAWTGEMAAEANQQPATSDQRTAEKGNGA